MLAGIGTVSGSIAIVVAAYLGKGAIRDIRHQKVVERQVEQAESSLAIAYQLKDAISEMRSPATWGYESEESREELSKAEWFQALPAEKQDRFVQANVFYMRMRRHEDVFNSAFSKLPFVRAFFGQSTEAAFRTILRCGRSVKVYADAYARDTGNDPNFSRKIEGVIWEGGIEPSDDQIGNEIKDAIGDIEAKLLPIIRISS